MNEQHDQLIGIERRLWSNDPEFYEATYLPGAVLVFDQIGRISRDDAVKAIREEKASGRYWAEVAFDDVAFSRIAQDAVLLTYAATARWNDEQAPSNALCSTVYLREAGRWRVALHQQTPGVRT